MFNETVTVFNYSKDSNGVKWYPTVLKNVRLQIIKNSLIEKTGISNGDSTKLFINDISLFKQPKAWESGKSGFFTFKTSKCFFVLGEYPTTVISDSDYTNGYYNHMINTHDNVYRVTNCDIYNAIPHLEVGGV